MTQDIYHFASSVEKVNLDGVTVISNYIVKGETLANGITFDEVLQGILRKEPKVDHQESDLVMSVEDTKTNTVTKRTRKKAEPEPVAPTPATADEAVGPGDTGISKSKEA